MLTIHRIDGHPHPLATFTATVSGLSAIDGQSIAVVPTSRNVKAATYRFRDAPVSVLTVADFWRYVLAPNLPPVPDELRLFLLRDAVDRLTNEERTGLFVHEDSEFFATFTAFAESGLAILGFLGETAREHVSIEELSRLATYTDFQPQMRIIMRIGELYGEELTRHGFSDPAVFPGSLSIDAAFAGRCRRVSFLSAGLLTRFELAALKTLSDEHAVDVHLFFHYAEETHPASPDVEAMLGEPIPDARPVDHAKAAAVVGTETALDQIELITRRAADLHHRHGVPYERMAVILPDDQLASSFIDRDPLRLFNVSGGIPLMRAAVAASLAHAVDLSMEAEGGALSIAKLLELIDFAPMAAMPGIIELSEKMQALVRRGRLTLSPDDPFIPEPLARFLAPALSAPERLVPADAARRLSAMVQSVPAPNTDPDDPRTTRHIDARASLIRTLDRLSRSLAPVTRVLGAPEAFAHVLAILAKNRLHHAGGPITVMEVLEARNMAYEAVFVPNMLEGSFPPRSGKDLFLNTEIRIEAGLPTASMRERLAMNYLAQVTNRASYVTYSYPAGREFGVPSRIVQRLVFAKGMTVESFRPAEPLTYSTEVPFAPYRVPNHAQVPVVKHDALMAVLGSRPIHSGMLNDYLTCPLKFCYRHLMQLKPPKAVEPELGPADISTELHDALASLVTDGIFALDDEFEAELTGRFKQRLDARDAYRMNPVAAFAADALVMRLPELVEAEKAWAMAGWVPVAAEKALTGSLDGFSLTGRADRIDRRGDEFAVIDYKMKDVRPLSNKPEKVKDVQMPLYGMMLEGMGMPPARYVHVDLKSKMAFIDVFSPAHLPTMKEAVEGIIEEIQNRELVFAKTDSRSRCTFCDYIELCERG